MSNASLKQRVARGAVWSLVDSLTTQGMTFALFIVLGRMLGPHVLGLLATAMVFVQLFRALVCDSIATAVISRENPTDEDYSTAFWLILLFSLVASLFLFFSAPALENLLRVAGLRAVLQGTSVIVLFTGFSRIHEAWLTRNVDFRSMAVRSAVGIGCGGVAGVALAANGYGIESLVTQQVVQSLIAGCVLFKLSKWRPSRCFSKQSAKEILHYAKHASTTALTNFGNQNSDLLFISYFLGAAASGTYSTAKRVLTALNAVLGGALTRIALPAFAHVQAERSRLTRAYLDATALTATATAPLFAAVGCLAPELINVFLGSQWEAAIPVMQILAVTGFVQSIGYYNHTVMLVSGKPHWQTLLTFVYAVTNIMAFCLVTKWGLVAVATAFTGRMLILYPVSVHCALRLLNLSPLAYIKGILPQIVSTAVMIGVMLGAKEMCASLSPALRLAVVGLSGGVAFVAAMIVIGKRQLLDGYELGARALTRRTA